MSATKDEFLAAFNRLRDTGERQIIGTFIVDMNGRGGVYIIQRRTYLSFFLNGQINPGEATRGDCYGGFKFWPTNIETIRAAKVMVIDEANELARREALARVIVD